MVDTADSGSGDHAAHHCWICTLLGSGRSPDLLPVLGVGSHRRKACGDVWAIVVGKRANPGTARALRATNTHSGARRSKRAMCGRHSTRHQIPHQLFPIAKARARLRHLSCRTGARFHRRKSRRRRCTSRCPRPNYVELHASGFSCVASIAISAPVHHCHVHSTLYDDCLVHMINERHRLSKYSTRLPRWENANGIAPLRFSLRYRLDNCVDVVIDQRRSPSRAITARRSFNAVHPGPRRMRSMRASYRVSAESQAGNVRVSPCHQHGKSPRRQHWAVSISVNGFVRDAQSRRSIATCIGVRTRPSANGKQFHFARSLDRRSRGARLHLPMREHAQLSDPRNQPRGSRSYPRATPFFV